MKSRQRLRVFLGPIEIAGHYSQLGIALREIGVDAVSVDLSGHPYRYAPAGKRSLWIRMAESVALRSARSRDAAAGVRLLYTGLGIITRLLLLSWALFHFDVFVFGYGRTIFWWREMPLLRRFGKRMIFVFNGSDARPPYIDGADMAPSLHRTVADCIEMAKAKKRRIHRIERYADVIVSQPAFSHFFERPVVDFFLLGVPWSESAPVRSRDRGSAIRALHSPSNPEVKGTEEIREAVMRVQASGVSIELIELSNVPNASVREEIGRADFVIDQLYSDAPMVSFATEAASVGVPAIVGGYAWPMLDSRYDPQSMPPVVSCAPEMLDDAIVRLATDVSYREAVGNAAQGFVHRSWAPKRVAERYLKLMLENPAPELLFDPASLRYTEGVGMRRERVQAQVKDVIDRGGRAALQLGDKPELEAEFVRFATEPSQLTPSN